MIKAALYVYLYDCQPLSPGPFKVQSKFYFNLFQFKVRKPEPGVEAISLFNTTKSILYFIDPISNLTVTCHVMFVTCDTRRCGPRDAA